MAEEDDPESIIPWPGFVDILSTVIIVFVFFMMMTSVVIFALSEQAKKTAVADAVRESKSEITSDQKKPVPDETLAPDISDLLKEKDKLKEEVDRLTQLKNVLSESALQTATRNKNIITITYGDMGATITPDTEKVITSALPHRGDVNITAYIPLKNNFAAIREVALNRALNIRNVLLQNKIANEHIGLKITVPKETPIPATNDPKQNDLADQESIYGTVTLTFTD